MAKGQSEVPYFPLGLDQKGWQCFLREFPLRLALLGPSLRSQKCILKGDLQTITLLFIRCVSIEKDFSNACATKYALLRSPPMCLPLAIERPRRGDKVDAVPSQSIRNMHRVEGKANQWWVSVGDKISALGKLGMHRSSDPAIRFGIFSHRIGIPEAFEKKAPFSTNAELAYKTQTLLLMRMDIWQNLLRASLLGAVCFNRRPVSGSINQETLETGSSC